MGQTRPFIYNIFQPTDAEETKTLTQITGDELATKLKALNASPKYQPKIPFIHHAHAL